MNIVVNCGFGIETATKLELKRKFQIEANAENGRISFEGDTKTLVELNLKLSTADRVLIKLASFKATTFDELFDGIVNISWTDFICHDAKILVSAKSNDSKLFAISSIQSITKKAIITSLNKKYKILPESGARHKIEISVSSDVVNVYLDSSGDGLHKRGYRDMVWEAPIKETIASAILELSVWNPERPFIDPFCGSGTFPIEACMRAINMPSGMYRKFDFEGFGFVDKSHLEELKKIAEEEIKRDFSPRISGFDINKKAVSLAVRHAKNFGLDKYIHFETNDMRNISSRYRYGVICTNPPYGERLVKDQSELAVLYKDFGKTFGRLEDWSLYLVTACESFEKYFGKRADKTRKLYNGGIECRLYRYLSNNKPSKS